MFTQDLKILQDRMEIVFLYTILCLCTSKLHVCRYVHINVLNPLKSTAKYMWSSIGGRQTVFDV